MTIPVEAAAQLCCAVVLSTGWHVPRPGGCAAWRTTTVNRRSGAAACPDAFRGSTDELQGRSVAATCRCPNRIPQMTLMQRPGRIPRVRSLPSNSIGGRWAQVRYTFRPGSPAGRCPQLPGPGNHLQHPHPPSLVLSRPCRPPPRRRPPLRRRRPPRRRQQTWRRRLPSCCAQRPRPTGPHSPKLLRRSWLP